MFTNKNQIKQLLHIASIKIPFFISNNPTQNLAIPIQNLNTVQSIVGKYPKISSSMVKVYYPIDLLLPKYTLIIYFETLQEAINMYQKQSKKQMNNPSLNLQPSESIDKQKKQVNNIYYCKDISSMCGIIFQPNKTFIKHPDNPKLKTIINLISKFVVLEGLPAQQMLKSKNLPILAFMDHKSFSIQNIYYRWRVYSYLQGDGDKIYRNEPFQMIEGGTIWYPPHESSPLKLFNMHERAYFSDLIMKLEIKKYQIQEAMSFAIYNINCAYQISQILIAWVVENTIPIFYLISDIFFNSALPIYRDIMSQVLPLIIRKIRIQYKKKMFVLQKLESIIKLWKNKFIFEEQYLEGLLFTLSNSQIPELQTSMESNQQIFNPEEHQSIASKCQSYGLPFIFNNITLTKQYIRIYQASKQISYEVAPVSSAYDGEDLNEKDISRIKMKNVKVFVCQNTNLGMLFSKKVDPQ